MANVNSPESTGGVKSCMLPEQAMAKLTTNLLLGSLEEPLETKSSELGPTLTFLATLDMTTLTKEQLAGWLSQIVTLSLQLKHYQVLVAQLQNENNGLRTDLISVKSDLCAAQAQIIMLKAQSKADPPKSGKSIISDSQESYHLHDRSGEPVISAPHSVLSDMTVSHTALSLEMTTPLPDLASSEAHHFSSTEGMTRVDSVREQAKHLRRQRNANQDHVAHHQKQLVAQNTVKGRGPPHETTMERPGTDPCIPRSNRVSQDGVRALDPPSILSQPPLLKPQRFDEVRDPGLTRPTDPRDHRDFVRPPTAHRGPDELTVRPCPEDRYPTDYRDKRYHKPPITTSSVRHGGYCPSIRDFDKVSQHIPLFNPKPGYVNDTSAFLRDIDYFSNFIPNATVKDKIHLIRLNSTREVRSLIERQPSYVLRDYGLLCQVLKEEYPDTARITDLTTAMMGRQGQQENPEPAHLKKQLLTQNTLKGREPPHETRVEQALSGSQNVEMEENNSLFTQNLHPTTSQDLEVEACALTLGLCELARSAFKNQQEAEVQLEDLEDDSDLDSPLKRQNAEEILCSDSDESESDSDSDSEPESDPDHCSETHSDSDSVIAQSDDESTDTSDSEEEVKNSAVVSGHMSMTPLY